MWITDEEFGTKEGLENALERVHNKAIEDTLRLLPDIIVGLIVRTQGTQSTYAKFKQDHPEFAGRENELRIAIEQIELEDGTLTLDEVLLEVPTKMAKMAMPIPTVQNQTPGDVAKTINGFI